MEPEDESQQTTTRRLGGLITLPFALVVPLVIGYFLGNWLDEKFETKPILTYSLLALGFIAGVLEFYRLVKSFGQTDDTN